ncbi:MAG: hypothetical protein A2340_12010 [Lentisphaerae bacterium RIFOXYB12_FULL_60_10]|nr:MAG: hypothetical protein A2269_02410 [Lentisphaerae bacterium RIFOXYA12_FULL_60_10]OGV78506.1 MAG: hypothetical protein A2340_12010 [Lentisphaerae bacterium RIFOXYB12_FULL_60_10]
MKYTHPTAFTLSALLVTCILVHAQTRTPIVGGDDMVVKMNLAAFRAAPIWNTLQAVTDKGSTTQSHATLKKRILDAVGFSDQDVRSIELRGQLGNLKPNDPSDWKQSNFQAVFDLSKPCSDSDFTTILNLCKEEMNLADISPITGIPGALRITPSANESTTLSVARSTDGRRIALAMTPARLTSALAPGHANTALSPNLQSILRATDERAGLRIAIRVPDSIRETIQAQIQSAQDPDMNAGNPMAAAFMAPLQNLQSIGLSALATTTLDLSLTADMGDPQAANQASVLLQTFLIPMIQQKTADSSNPGKTLRTSSQGSILNLSITLDETDIKTMQSGGMNPDMPMAPDATE